MDMQNVSKLTIPEGEVKTIHNSNSQLLWGRVNYNTKYAGDTYQQTYSGKNLLKITDVNLNGVKTTLNSDGSISCVGKTTTNYFSITNYQSPVDKVIPAGTYTYSRTGYKAHVVNCQLWDQDKSNYVVATINAGDTNGSVTAPFDIYYYNVACTQLASGTDIDFTTTLQLEAGSTATSFEKFVGGTASPNPDYPQNVNVVTGEQTISVSDGGSNSTDYTVDLDSIQLCKIDTYQDYIYKSGDDWYVHKEIGKAVLNGVGGAYNSTNNWYYVGVPPETPVLNSSVLSDYFTGTTSSYMVDNPNANGVIAITSNTYVLLRNTDCVDLTSYRTWLSTHNTTIYYALATPTDTQITNTDLINQLDAVHQWLTRYGYNSSVIGNLPMIISREEL